MVSKQLERTIEVFADSRTLEGLLTIPEGATGVVLFAHGAGSGRLSPRNQCVAGVLNQEKIATLLLDLLTPEEDDDYRKRFDIDLLAERLGLATEWLKRYPETKALGIGLFGGSTGAAAALKLAARQPADIRAVVSRGGRTDLADEELPLVQAPTFIIVGSNDEVVLELNRRSYSLLQAEKRLEVVAGASHLFEEPGTLDRVADLAADWFKGHLT